MRWLAALSLLAAAPASAGISYEFVGQPGAGLQAFVINRPDFIPSPFEVKADDLNSCNAAFTSCEGVFLFSTTSNGVAVLFLETGLQRFTYFFPNAALDRVGRYQASPDDGIPGLLNILGVVDTPPIDPPFEPLPVLPEPGTWALLISGFGLVGATLRRRRGIARA